jgi:energy-coupling factor transporter ATP-binding protein EcfA2
MITRLQIENFKSWRRADLPFGKLTAFFGANSSGKTSILQLLLLLRQTVEAPDPSMPLFLGDRRSLADLGTFYDLIHQHDLQKVLRWQLEWQIKPRTLFEISDIERVEQMVEIGWEGGGQVGRMVVRSMSYRFDKHRILYRREGKRYEIESDPPPLLKRSPGRPPVHKEPIKCYGFPESVRVAFQNAEPLFELAHELTELAQRIYYIGPLREYPQRQYLWSGAEPSDVGSRGENTIAALLASRRQGKTIPRSRPTKTVEAAVAEQLKKLGLIQSLDVREVVEGSRLYEVKVRLNERSAEVSLADVGFGISQALPVITLCYFVPKDSIVILEQPEIHLHPAVQMGLADTLIDAIQRNNIQIILESHSEHLLTRLQRRIAEGKLSHSEVKLYFCQFDGQKSIAEPLELDEYGNISNWPPDFFGDMLGEAIEAQKARNRRMAHGK